MPGAFGITPAAWPSLAAAAFLAALSFYSWRRPRVPGALPLAIGSLFATLWLLGIFFEMAATDPETKIAWRKFQTVWQLAGVSATTGFVLEYTRPGRRLNRYFFTFLAIPPILVLAIILLGQTGLLWRTLGIGADGSVATEPAAVGTILLNYALALVVLNALAFTGLFVRSPQHRWPIAIMLFGEIASRALWLAGETRTTRVNADVMAILLVWGAYAVALFGFRILDPLGAARQTVIRQMREGMVVFDNQWRAVSVNPAAERILGARESELRGRTWGELLPAAGPAPVDTTTQPSLPPLTLGAPDRPRSYALDLSPLMDQRGLRAGSLLLLLDTTEQRRAQAQAETQARTLAVLAERERLARELHDSAGQVLAFVNTQGQAARRLLARGDVEVADDYLARLVEVAQEADTDLRESILGLRVALTGQGLAQALTVYLAQYQKRSGIRAELVGDALDADALEPFVEAQLLRIAQEALTNARKHSGARSVRVVLERDPTNLTIRIEDDGCGFDADMLRERGESVGLRVMRERARDAGGAISVQSAPGQGTSVRVTAPAHPITPVSIGAGETVNARASG
jgi:signal transduction histidine kinase